MGYTARYHAASLAAVFVALAIGILIGVGFGDDVAHGRDRGPRGEPRRATSTTRAPQVDDLEAELERERDFAERACTRRSSTAACAGAASALIALGDLPDGDRARTSQAALEPTGAELTQVAVVREPPDVEALGRAAAAARRVARRARAAIGGAWPSRGRAPRSSRAALIYDGCREPLLRRFSGDRPGRRGRSSSASGPRTCEDPEEARASCSSGVLDGHAAQARAPVVGVERSDAEPVVRSRFFDSLGLDHGRQPRPGRRPGRAGLRAARRRGQLRRQGGAPTSSCRRCPAAARARRRAP